MRESGNVSAYTSILQATHHVTSTEAVTITERWTVKTNRRFHCVHWCRIHQCICQWIYSTLLVTCPVTLQIANYFLLTANPVVVLEISLIGLEVICYLQFNTCNWTAIYCTCISKYTVCRLYTEVCTDVWSMDRCIHWFRIHQCMFQRVQYVLRCALMYEGVCSNVMWSQLPSHNGECYRHMFHCTSVHTWILSSSVKCTVNVPSSMGLCNRRTHTVCTEVCTDVS